MTKNPWFKPLEQLNGLCQLPFYVNVIVQEQFRKIMIQVLFSAYFFSELQCMKTQMTLPCHPKVTMFTPTPGKKSRIKTKEDTRY